MRVLFYVFTMVALSTFNTAYMHTQANSTYPAIASFALATVIEDHGPVMSDM